MRPATKKRLRAMGYPSYRAYCNSDHWQKRKERYWKKHPKVCAVPDCKKRKGLALHHRSYQNLGKERDWDLIPLCSGHHRGLHTFMKRKRVKLEIAFPKYVLWLESRSR